MPRTINFIKDSFSNKIKFKKIRIQKIFNVIFE